MKIVKVNKRNEIYESKKGNNNKNKTYTHSSTNVISQFSNSSFVVFSFENFQIS